MRVRPETPGDKDAIVAVNQAAFGSTAEARLVDLVRDQVRPIISLVAEDNDEIVGHILFSPVHLSGNPQLRLMGLAPMAVTPDHQRQGIGSLLVRAGLQACRELGTGAVVVLGHPAYYPRFGFVPTTSHGIHSEYQAPAEAFLLLELDPGCLAGATGTIRYHSVFSDH
ncbi:MAG: N-acetyltransferase [Gammaproteobacteria bacterium]|jgi:putative acetyltransferase|nr:N-acetyltransferase [Gammaproteobacteria bacterium]